MCSGVETCFGPRNHSPAMERSRRSSATAHNKILDSALSITCDHNSKVSVLEGKRQEQSVHTTASINHLQLRLMNKQIFINWKTLSVGRWDGM